MRIAVSRAPGAECEVTPLELFFDLVYFFAIAHPGDDATLGFTILTFGGPALFLLAQVVFLYEALGRIPHSRWLGLAALAILAVATAPLTLMAGIAAACAVLVGVAIADTLATREREPAAGSR